MPFVKAKRGAMTLRSNQPASHGDLRNLLNILSVKWLTHSQTKKLEIETADKITTNLIKNVRRG